MDLMSIDFAAVVKIIAIDLLLGIDNAVVIALACAALAMSIRNKAVLIGTGGAVVLRAVLLVFASVLLSVPYLKLVAGAYLVFIGIKLLLDNEEAHDVAQKTTIFGAVWTIIVADFMLSLDNVLAVAAAANEVDHSVIASIAGVDITAAVAYSIAGIVFSIPIIIFGAKYLANMMNRWPIIVWIGAAMLGTVGCEMIISDPFVATYSIDHMLAKVVGAALVVSIAFIVKKFKPSEQVA